MPCAIDVTSTVFPARVVIREVGLRDGLQSIATIVSTEQLYDSVTSELLARVMDAEAAQDFGAMQIRNSVTNRADADRILKKWADALGEHLAQARSKAASAS